MALASYLFHLRLWLHLHPQRRFHVVRFIYPAGLFYVRDVDSPR